LGGDYTINAGIASHKLALDLISPTIRIAGSS
jgi:hypothetical protein